MTALLAMLAYLPALLQILPSIIAFVEATHGSTPGQGEAKKAAATQIIQAMIPELEQHLTTDPAKLKVVHGLIDLGVGYMNAKGTMPGAALAIVQAPAFVQTQG